MALTRSTASVPSAACLPGTLDGSVPGFMDAAAGAFFKDNGYLVVENALDASELAVLKDDAVAICRGTHGTYGGWQGPHEGQSDDEVMRQYLCIHFPHKISAPMHAMLGHRAMVETLTGCIGPDVKAMQSMLFVKSSGKPGQAWHQDEDYIPTRDRSLMGGWIALDDATVENGCLWVIPGSHRAGVLWPQAEQADDRFDCTAQSTGFPYTDADAVAVEVRAGSIVFFNGYLLHRSLPNRSATGYRRVLVNHYMSASSLLPWTDNLQTHGRFLDEGRSVAKADYRDVVLVAGTDPYAWMGTDDVARPHVRPSGEGGCASSGAAADQDA